MRGALIEMGMRGSFLEPSGVGRRQLTWMLGFMRRCSMDGSDERDRPCMRAKAGSRLR